MLATLDVLSWLLRRIKSICIPMIHMTVVVVRWKSFFFQNILNVMAALLEFVMFTYRNFLYLYSNITNEEVQTELKSGK